MPIDVRFKSCRLVLLSVKRRGLAASLLLLSVAACSQGVRSDARYDSGVNDASVEYPLYPVNSCGGTVEANGMIPGGSFSAGAIEITEGCGGSAIFFILGDSSGQAVLTLTVKSLLSDAGTSFVLPQGETSVDAKLDTRKARPISTSALIDIATTSNASFQTFSGNVEATFSVSQDGFSISGSLSSPYCQYNCPAL